MNKLIGFFVLFLFVIPNSLAQIIDNNSCNAFTELPFFDTTFIKRNGVKNIVGYISTKAELKQIVDTKKTVVYSFDHKGRLSNQYGSFVFSSGLQDTVYHQYIYDKSGNILIHRTADSYGYFSYNYEYDPNGHLIKKTYCRDENENTDYKDFVLKKQYIIVEENYKVIDNDSLVVQEFYNQQNRKYQTINYRYNEFKLLTEENGHFLISKKKFSTTYTYNDLGKVASKTVLADLSKPQNKKEWLYKYDDLGNLTYIDYYENEKHTSHQEVLYDKSNYTLKALLVQNMQSNFLHIIKFYTEFY